MKKLILSSMGFSSSIFVFAQEKTNGVPASSLPNLNQNIMESANQNLHIETIVSLIIIGLLVFFTISILKYILEHRLKNKIIERGISEQLSASILEKNGKNKYDEAMKLAILLCSIGVGLILTYCTMPLHIHSLAIMAFSIGAGYLGYFFYLKNQNR
ncbi:hypothetical protein [Pedobacter caeni]|nr:hypothetical protein [Pedobacter caeni]